MNKVYLKRVVNNGVKCVYAYNDKEGTDLKAIFSDSIVSLPNKRRKVITMNCFKFICEWI
jgi:hypothetical protein